MIFCTLFCDAYVVAKTQLFCHFRYDNANYAFDSKHALGLNSFTMIVAHRETDINDINNIIYATVYIPGRKTLNDYFTISAAWLTYGPRIRVASVLEL